MTHMPPAPDDGSPRRPDPSVGRTPPSRGDSVEKPLWRRRAFLSGLVVAGAAAGGLAWHSGGQLSHPGSTPSGDEAEAGARRLRTKTARGWVSVDFVAAGIARVRITASPDQRVAYSYAVDRALPAVPAEATSDDSGAVLAHRSAHGLDRQAQRCDLGAKRAERSARHRIHAGVLDGRRRLPLAGPPSR